MTLQDVIDYTRRRLNNYERPYRWLDVELVSYANEAVKEICRDGMCLVDPATESTSRIFTSDGVIDYALSPLVVYVLSAKVVISEKMSLDVAAAPAHFAVAATITGATSHKTCEVVSYDSTTAYTIDSRSGTFTLGEVLSDGTNSADQGAAYPVFTDNSTSSVELSKTTAWEIDRNIPQWRVADTNQPARWLVDYRTGYLSVYPPPDGHYPIYLSVVRYPLTDFSTTAMSTQTPEIDAAYHHAIIDGICWQAFLKPGENTFDERKANYHLGMFRKAISGMKIQGNLFGGGEKTASPHGGFI